MGVHSVDQRAEKRTCSAGSAITTCLTAPDTPITTYRFRLLAYL
jgi:hypothetical protein